MVRKRLLDVRVLFDGELLHLIDLGKRHFHDWLGKGLLLEQVRFIPVVLNMSASDTEEAGYKVVLIAVSVLVDLANI